MKNVAAAEVKVNDKTVLLVLHCAVNPTRDEWSDILSIYDRYARAHDGDFSNLRVVVVSDGGGPSARERQIIMEHWGKYPMRIAVFSNNPVMRGIMTTFAWLAKVPKMYAPKDFVQALKDFDLSPESARVVLEQFKVMQGGLKPVACLQDVLKVQGMA